MTTTDPRDLRTELITELTAYIAIATALRDALKTADATACGTTAAAFHAHTAGLLRAAHLGTTEGHHSPAASPRRRPPTRKRGRHNPRRQRDGQAPDSTPRGHDDA
ncbi:hypothetical protein [Nocardia sp. XZ_19_369]|uniref:hypothetical protein n=1 Tax=Nocardia sp. XZ_19_369 TaxID=2769487 RepID=UPI00188E2259|nr:hypothetical protein [Nocardia sp. XZ_19_369]